MKGDEKLIEVLNQLLADELTAISQYMVHSEMCDHWGFDGLHGAIEERAIEEMRHAEWLIGRILFLEGIPIVSKLNPMEIGKTVPEMIANDIKAEHMAVKAYNEGIALASDVGDEGTGDLLTKILGDEENHIDQGEKQQAQIAQMGLENYLVMQIGDEK
ncbi:MAG: bacterioferritin [Anaerolineae bacterium SM23_ 63]|nr:MAG: bacterioferritin [Anaerolineae bacterium SM23_ 63]HEY47435.1 bacterioferritin [Anaerolineae bacterium]